VPANLEPKSDEEKRAEALLRSIGAGPDGSLGEAMAGAKVNIVHSSKSGSKEGQDGSAGCVDAPAADVSSYTHGWLASCTAGKEHGYCEHGTYGDAMRKYCPVSCSSCPPDKEEIQAAIKKLSKKKRLGEEICLVLQHMR
jgi:hypothetical protein